MPYDKNELFTSVMKFGLAGAKSAARVSGRQYLIEDMRQEALIGIWTNMDAIHSKSQNERRPYTFRIAYCRAMKLAQKEMRLPDAGELLHIQNNSVNPFEPIDVENAINAIIDGRMSAAIRRPSRLRLSLKEAARGLLDGATSADVGRSLGVGRDIALRYRDMLLEDLKKMYLS